MRMCRLPHEPVAARQRWNTIYWNRKEFCGCTFNRTCCVRVVGIQMKAVGGIFLHESGSLRFGFAKRERMEVLES